MSLIAPYAMSTRSARAAFCTARFDGATHGMGESEGGGHGADNESLGRRESAANATATPASNDAIPNANIAEAIEKWGIPSNPQRSIMNSGDQNPAVQNSKRRG